MRVQDAYRLLTRDARHEADEAYAAGLPNYKCAALVRVLLFWQRYDEACRAAELAEAPQPAYADDHRRALARLARLRADVQSRCSAKAAPVQRPPVRRGGIGSERGHYLHRCIGAWCSANAPSDLPEVVAGRVLGRPPVRSFAHDLSDEDERTLLAYVQR